MIPLIPRPPPAAPAAGGRGISSRVCVYSVGCVGSPAGGAMEGWSWRLFGAGMSFRSQRSSVEICGVVPAPSLPGISGSVGGASPFPDLAWRRIWVDDFGADGDEASVAAGGGRWRLFGVRVSTTSRPSGGFFRSKASGKMRRRRVIDASSSVPATSTQLDLCVISLFLLSFSAYLL